MEGDHHAQQNQHNEGEGEHESTEYHWPALESDPEIFTNYMTKLGMSNDWHICEVFGLDEECLGFVPQPCVAAIVTFERKTRDDGKPGAGADSKIVPFYMKQTGKLDNACGIIACLHAILNHHDEITLNNDSILHKFRKDSENMTPQERARYLEDFTEFKEEHKVHASQGQSEAPTSAEKVNHHFVAFIKNADNQLVEVDGTKNGPAVIEENCEDLLKSVSKELQRRLSEDLITDHLSLMALAKTP